MVDDFKKKQVEDAFLNLTHLEIMLGICCESNLCWISIISKSKD